MESSSIFQQQNPLSRRKFIKKFIPVFFRAIFTTAIICMLSIFVSEIFVENIGPHEVTWSGMGEFALAAIGIYLLIIIGNAFYIRAYIKRYYYDAGEQFITIKKGVFAPTEIHVQYGKIQDVYVDQDILDRILGIYDVHIASATVMSGIEAHIDGVDKEVAERIKNTFLGKITGDGVKIETQSPLNISNIVQTSVHLPKEISSATYPFDPMFRASVFLSSIIYALLGVVFIIGFMHVKNPYTLLVLFVFMYAALVTYELVWMKNYFFSFEKDMIVIKSKVIGTTEKHVPYHTIQDVVLNQGILARLFGIGTVLIQNATTGGLGAVGLSGQPIEKAKELVEVVRGITGRTQSSRSGL
jgi:membrane protein YdbS with pleckstrin-like domain